jgi:hypothetical protein
MIDPVQTLALLALSITITSLITATRVVKARRQSDTRVRLLREDTPDG